MPDKDLQRLYAIVEGRVQGVGFRNFVLEAALSLGLNGWVRNRWDDSVEVVAEGEEEALDKFLQKLRRGPRAAYVTGVNQDWQPATGEFRDFRIRHTA